MNSSLSNMPSKEGLSSERAAALLEEYGYNELPSAKPKSLWRIAVEVIKEPMFILLLCCGTIYFLLGDFSEGIILLCWVFVIVFITFYQSRKTERSLEALRALSSPRALVLRGGFVVRIAGREVVPGDVLLLNEGDRIAADALLFESNFLSVDESVLTGESLPVLKEADEAGRQEIFSGTLVVQGSGKAIVTATATRTKFGSIGVSLNAIEKGDTRLQTEMKQLIRRLFLVGGVLSVGVIAGYYATRGSWAEALVNGVAAAMALLPEEFPVVLTIFFALGAWRLSRIHVLTRTPSAIETLGAATVLCSDKTGTITQNRMRIAALYACGEVFDRSTFTQQRTGIAPMLEVLFHASSADSIDPMEKAIEEECIAQSINIESGAVVKEYPFNKTTLSMTRVLRYNGRALLRAYCKGAPEKVLAFCAMGEDEREKHLKVVHAWAGLGYRVIAAGQSEVEEANLPMEQAGFSFSFSGLIAFADPIREEVPKAVKECHMAGVKVIMITGDYPETASSIAAQIGLENPQEVITGATLQGLSVEELSVLLRRVRVFARIVPEQKLQIVEALKANGEVVAMTGDGVNDAPALKAADIGVAMGLKGTDVAREASVLVLLDDNFASIVAAIRAGRRIFDNLQKAMTYVIAIHIPIIGLVLVPAFMIEWPVLLMPLHIVFMEMIIDPVSSVAFESEQEERNIMTRQPRDAQARFFGWGKMFFSAVQGLLLLLVVLAVCYISMGQGHSSDQVRAITFVALIMGNLVLVVSSLSRSRSFVAVLKEGNKAMLVIVCAALLMLFVSFAWPFLSSVFSFEFPGFYHVWPAVASSALLLLILESLKKIWPLK